MAHAAPAKRNGGPRRILLVTPRYPFPVIGGDKLRVYNIVKYLSRYYSFGLASLYSTPEEEAAAPERGIFDEVYRVRQPRALSWWRTAGSLLKGASLQSGYFYNPRLKRLVDEKIGGYDLVMAHLFRVSDHISDRSVPAICELTDAISMNYERARTGGMSLRRLLYGFERKRCLDAEKRCLDRFDGCVVVSHKDRDYLAERCPEHSAKMHVIPNGVRLERFPYARDRVTRSKIIFIGNMRTMQNEDAACHFARDVFPGVREERPEATFWVIGADPGRAVRALSSIPGVVVTGRVDDVTAYARDAAVSVCPVRVGAGVQNKVLESMAMGVPVVTTSVGAEGLLAKDREHIMVADGAGQMKERVLGMLDGGEGARALSRNARRLVEESYSWEGMLRSYRDLVESVMNRGRECRRS